MDDQDWFAQNDATSTACPTSAPSTRRRWRTTSPSTKLIRGIETRTKPGRFLAKFFPNLTPDQVRQYANNYLVATANSSTLLEPRTRSSPPDRRGAERELPDAGYYRNDTDTPWYDGHPPAACYASGDFEVAYITDNNKPASLVDLHAGDQRITARAICNATNKTVARIYGDAAKMLPLLTAAGYTQVERRWSGAAC